MSQPLIAVDARLTDKAGIGRFLRELLPRLIQRLPEYHWALIGDPERLQGLASDRVALVNCTAPIYGLREQWALARAMPSGVDLFWSPHYNIPLLYRGRLAVTVHDIMHLSLACYREALHKRLYADIMFRLLAMRAARVFTPSEFTRKDLATHTHVPLEAVRAIHNGVDEGWFRLRNENSPRPQEKPYCLYVGSIKPHKNLSRTLEAFTRIRDHIPHDLILIGQYEGLLGADGDVTRQLLGAEGRVRLAGPVDDRQLRSWMRHAELLVMPSLYEGFGLPPLEAMACGVPVLASIAASLPEVCGEAAAYCNPEDAGDMADVWLRLLRDADWRRELVKCGDVQSRRFSWNAAADAYASEFRALLQSS